MSISPGRTGGGMASANGAVPELPSATGVWVVSARYLSAQLNEKCQPLTIMAIQRLVISTVQMFHERRSNLFLERHIRRV